ncbi:hypothetical protein [Deinococcus aquaedulcis]|uniref:hypothetical protein n=1 Tax=Deinococcus aquaedulcis TaxID=2840455 RepID=UPI001C83E141|nr:hypothetical protein [Deinococcus aquaedulcis]
MALEVPRSHLVRPALALTVLLGGALAAPALNAFSLEVKRPFTPERSVVSGKAPASYKVDTFFEELDHTAQDFKVEFEITGAITASDMTAPRQLLRREKTAARQVLVFDTQGNRNFSSRYHLRMVVAARGVPGRFVACAASTETLALLTEAVAICDSLTVRKKYSLPSTVAHLAPAPAPLPVRWAA